MPNPLNTFDVNDIVDENKVVADLLPGKGKRATGHEIFHNLYYKNMPVVVKINKRLGRKGEEASILEVAFSAITKLFMRPGLTAPQNILTKNGKVYGVASQSMSYQISTLRIQGKQFYKLKDNVGANLSPPWQLIDAQDPDECTYTFFNDKPQYFFDDLMKLKANGVSIDMDSLACILTTSYTLEEDDFHKGNFGFYVIEEDGRPKITFFKIDHDLMFNDSIMSRKDMRPANIMYDDQSFKITTHDLRHFPALRDSKNHYWPTQWRFFTHGIKAYSRGSERKAYRDLRNNDAFIQAKWKYFLKFILIPHELILPTLTTHLDPEKDLVEITMIRTALSERLAALRQTLLAVKGFKNYLMEHGNEVLATLKEDLSQTIDNFDNGLNHEMLMEQNINTLFLAAKYPRALCRKVLLGDYSFSNVQGTRAIHEALEIAQQEFKNAKKENTEKAFLYACIIIDLMQNKMKNVKLPSSRDVSCVREASNFKLKFLGPMPLTTFEQFQLAVAKIRQTRLPLAQQKKEVIALLKISKLPKDELNLLKIAIDKNAPNASLTFVRQLRSSLWLIRRIRGTYGPTSTVYTLRNVIAAQMDLNPNVGNEQKMKFSDFQNLFWRSAPAVCKAKKELASYQRQGKK